MTSPLRAQITAAAQAFAEAIADAVEKNAQLPEWYDQYNSPLGKRRHLGLVSRGELVAVKDGRKVLVKRTDLEAYLLAHPRLTREDETGEVDEDAKAAEVLGLRKVR